MNHEQPAPPLVDIDNKVFTNYIILNKTRHGISSDTAPGRVVFYTLGHGGIMAEKISFSKPSRSPQQQVALLESRGVQVYDREEAEHFLRYHNYYQISGYVYYFEVKGPSRTHRLAQPISFSDLISLVCFDQELRFIFFKLTTEIEIALRCSVAYRLSQAYGPFCFENPDIFRYPEQAQPFKEILLKALAAHDKEPFVAHFTRTYQEPIPPAWVMVELITLGNISWLYSQLRTDLQKTIAKDFSVDHMILVSWLKALTELRNTCAHHMRLWNKVFVNYPKIRKADESFPIIPDQKNRLGSFLPMIFHLMRILHKNQDRQTDLLQFLRSQPLIKPKDMGLSQWP
jgi:abortive infection bacteriophage resistance protein